MKRAVLIAMVLAARTAAAENKPKSDMATETPPSDGPPPATIVPDDPDVDAPNHRPTDEPTAADADGAPLPGTESGRTDSPSGDSVLRNIGQGVLFVPRVALVTAITPVRVGVWAYDRYHIYDRFNQAFFDDDAIYGLYPTLTLDSSWGLNVGARAVHRNLFGAHEKFALRGSTGGQYRSLVDGRLVSGRRLGSRVTVELRAEYEEHPRDPYFGTGNANDRMQTRFREEMKRATTFLDLKTIDRLVVRTTGSIASRVFAPSAEGTPIDAVYDTTMLTGFGGAENLYGELELRWDQRGREETPGRHEIYDTGYFLSAFSGRVHQLQQGQDYWRYGGEGQLFLGLGPNPRSLMARLHVEAVTGQRDDVVFSQMPALGGSQLLRGYSPARFRDRAAAVSTLEYFWGLGQLFMASAFVDAGRVYPSLQDVTATGMRVGFGGSLQLHGNRHFISGVTVASSIDGGVFASLTFDPVFDYDPRGDRR